MFTGRFGTHNRHEVNGWVGGWVGGVGWMVCVIGGGERGEKGAIIHVDVFRSVSGVC